MSDQRPTDPGHTDAPQFDPRHSPVFQRGYDPATDGAAPSRAQGRASARRFPAQERAVDRAVIHGVDAAVAPPRGPVAAAEQPPADLTPTDLTEDWTDDRPARNPYIVALWIIGIGLVVGAVSFQWWALKMQNSFNGSSNEMPVEYVLFQLSWVLSPAMISAGLLTIVGLTVWKAIRWSEREGRSPAHEPLADTHE